MATKKDMVVTGSACFTVVGIGSSAGGLEALEQLFRNIQPDSGMAYVLVSHLDPSHASILTEIMQRVTSMPVVEALDQMMVAPDHVYVIPPNRDMAIFQGALQLSVPEQPRGQRMPIDAFLRSLAEDYGENAIGIILSGTGSDGTQGLRAVLGAGGISLVQEPKTAKYDGMPCSAINAGYATHILPVEKMPEVLLAAGRRVSNLQHVSTPAVSGGINRILMMLRNATGHDFSLYKKSTIGRRIERRMAQHNIDNTEVYARYLKERPDEIRMLFKELLINVTSFFRDPEAFDALKREALPLLFADKPDGYVFRVWVAGCASGEEAYSIAMLLREFMDEIHREFKILLYATDLDDDAIAQARAGFYTLNITQDVPYDRLRRFFVKEETGYRVKKDVREMVVFATQNVIKDPPFTRLDLLSCRNLMIYLEAELQNILIPTFHYALKPGGVLFLSPSESIPAQPHLFLPLSRKWKLYRAIGSAVSTREMLCGGLMWTRTGKEKESDEVPKKIKEVNFDEVTKRALLQSYAPASVLTDARGNILFVYGDTGHYLRPSPGQATLNVIEMARDGMQLELRTAITVASSATGRLPLSREVSVKSNGESRRVRLDVHPLNAPDNTDILLLISFQEMAQPDKTLSDSPEQENSGTKGRGKSGHARSVAAKHGEMRRVEELERELIYTRENLQATVEEQQASNEELKSINEELQSTNEELQSTNEELETSREELQSVNEEMITVNAELQAKIEQLAGMQNDIKNLLDNINVGTIFLDGHMTIRRFTRDAVRAYRLVATDVGRPLSDIKSDIACVDLLDMARVVLNTLVPWEGEVQTLGGSWYLARIRPYRTLDNVIDGVVLTFTDISQRVAAEEAVRNARILAENIVDTVREPLIVLNSSMQVISASRSFYQLFQITAEHTVGRQLYELCGRRWDIPELRELLENILPRDQSLEKYAVEGEFPSTGHLKLSLNARRITGELGSDQLILLAMEVVS